MPKKLEDYQKIAKQLIDRDRKLINDYDQYELMDQCVWALPADMPGWVKTVISSDPHDAVTAGARVLSGLDDRIKLHPLSSTSPDKQRANEWERNLLWQMMNVNRRAPSKKQREMARSALLYDAVMAQVVDLDYQIEAMKMFGGSTARYDTARRYGRFMVNVHNPKNVRVRYSSSMPEAVLLHELRPAQAIMDEWGDLAKKLKQYADEDKSVKYYDYMDYEMRCVWIEGEGEAMPIVKPMEHGLSFLPWAIAVGGEERRPLLYAILKTDEWNVQNMVKSLYTSEVIAHAGSPRYKEEGANPSETEVDYGDTARTAKVPAGNVLTPIPPPQIDQALLQIDDRVSAAMDKSTVSRILLGGDLPSGTAYATLNLATQTALGSLKRSKEVTEKALAEVYTLMLLWTAESGKSLYGYESKGDNVGEEYVIESDEIEPSAIYITVKLEPDVPTDRMQKINAAIMAQQIGLSKERALEELGISDPEAELDQFWMEKMEENRMNIIMQEEQFQAQAQQQMIMQQLQQQMAMEQQQQAQDMQAQQQLEQQYMQGMMNQQEAPGIPGLGGQGFNPAFGGTPPAMFAPEMTREEVTGQALNGVPVEGEI
ncbi:MAG: hypothetical protein ACWGQW_04930 [bacterium]